MEEPITPFYFVLPSTVLSIYLSLKERCRAIAPNAAIVLFRSLLSSPIGSAAADFCLYFFIHVGYFLYNVFK